MIGGIELAPRIEFARRFDPARVESGEGLPEPLQQLESLKAGSIGRNCSGLAGHCQSCASTSRGVQVTFPSQDVAKKQADAMPNTTGGTLRPLFAHQSLVAVPDLEFWKAGALGGVDPFAAAALVGNDAGGCQVDPVARAEKLHSEEG